MSLRQRLPFAMLFTVAALAPYVRPNDCPAKADEPRLSPAFCAPASSAAALPSGHARRAHTPDLWRNLSAQRSSSLTALSFPAQFRNPNDLAAGKLLVASRGVADPDFAATVVLLIHYDEKGVFGLILNRRTHIPLSQVLDLKSAKDRTDPVYLGGPVGASDVFALVQSTSTIKKAEKVFDGVYLISDKELFNQTLSAHPDPGNFHVYLGYTGWSQDQLRNEVQLGAWYIFPADATAVFTPDPGALWQQMMENTHLKWARLSDF